MASPTHVRFAPSALLRVDLLGPVEVSCQGADVTLSPLERNLLVVLALTPGIAVSTDRLIDDLWGSHLPAAPRSRLQGLVSGLRRKIGDVVRTRHPGYLIDPAALQRDLDDCERLAAEARRATEATERVRLLAAAQSVWRGEPLEGISTPGVAPERARLAELRLSLLEARSEAELELGNHRALTSLLAPAVAENPLREQLVGLYITALYRSSRQADAMAVYHELRERLADEVGSDACPELRDLYARILRGDALPAATGPSSDEGARTGPSQLPPRDGLFLARTDHLTALDDACGSTPAVVVVSGPGGIGKTALVVEWAHGAAPGFPDGQLFLDLGGDTRSPSEVLAAALLALGVAEDDLPVERNDRIRLYRAVVHDRRLLVVADDAGCVDQVLALVPPGPHSRLVVTTRLRLVCLAAHHDVREIVLPPLPAQAAGELLDRVVGPERLTGHARCALVRWCGGWPLLLRHAAAQLAFRPSQPVASFVEELCESTSEHVLHDDVRSVEAALADAHAGLSPAAARLFERLSLHDGTLCVHVAAVAAGSTLNGVRRLLDELTTRHLLVETTSALFGLHEVVARFGRRLAAEQGWTAPTAGYPADVVWACRECSGAPADLAGLEITVPAASLVGDPVPG